MKQNVEKRVISIYGLRRRASQRALSLVSTTHKYTDAIKTYIYTCRKRAAGEQKYTNTIAINVYTYTGKIARTDALGVAVTLCARRTTTWRSLARDRIRMCVCVCVADSLSLTQLSKVVGGPSYVDRVDRGV